MSEPIHIISLGAGVQSSTMALMAAKGEITPVPTAAIFADTQAEPKSVYTWLDWLERQLPFEVRRVSRGNLADEAIRIRVSKKSGNTYTKHNIPAFIIDDSGSIGIMNRHCTGDFKIDVIIAALRILVGMKSLRDWRAKHRLALKELAKWKKICALAKKAKQVPPIRPMAPWKECQDDALVIQWIGISADEVSRAKENRHPWIRNIWPLLDKHITRRKCLEWMKQNQFPEPPRSACVFCPFHDDKEWLRMKTQDPKSFMEASVWELKMQAAMAQSSELRGKPFLHSSCKLISEIDFSRPTLNQPDLFNNECEGMCGV